MENFINTKATLSWIKKCQSIANSNHLPLTHQTTPYEFLKFSRMAVQQKLNLLYLLSNHMVYHLNKAICRISTRLITLLDYVHFLIYLPKLSLANMLVQCLSF